MNRLYLDEDYDNDDDVFKNFNDLLVMHYMTMFMMMLSWDLLIANELEEGGDLSVSTNIGVRDMLDSMQSFLSFFKQNTNFCLMSFKDCVV